MGPDWAEKPEAVPYSKLDNPQSLNLYQHVGNNPLSKADKDGHCYPWCTALAGAVLGALAAGIHEKMKGEDLNWKKVGAAAAGGALAGVVGPAGAAADLGTLGTVGFAAYGGVLGGCYRTRCE